MRVTRIDPQIVGSPYKKDPNKEALYRKPPYEEVKMSLGSSSARSKGPLRPEAMPTPNPESVNPKP